MTTTVEQRRAKLQASLQSGAKPTLEALHATKRTHYPRLIPPAEVTRYGNGRIPPGALTPLGIGSHRLFRPAAEAFKMMVNAARAEGVNIGVTDSYRTLASQVDLARRKGLYSQGGLAAKPGTSNHGWGMALDLNLDGRALAWMRANANRFGFVEDTPREPWHWGFRPDSLQGATAATAGLNTAIDPGAATSSGGGSGVGSASGGGGGGGVARGSGQSTMVSESPAGGPAIRTPPSSSPQTPYWMDLLSALMEEHDIEALLEAIRNLTPHMSEEDRTKIAAALSKNPKLGKTIAQNESLKDLTALVSTADAPAGSEVSDEEAPALAADEATAGTVLTAQVDNPLEAQAAALRAQIPLQA